jgi:hypothetical protein
MNERQERDDIRCDPCLRELGQVRDNGALFTGTHLRSRILMLPGILRHGESVVQGCICEPQNAVRRLEHIGRCTVGDCCSTTRKDSGRRSVSHGNRRLDDRAGPTAMVAVRIGLGQIGRLISIADGRPVFFPVQSEGATARIQDHVHRLLLRADQDAARIIAAHIDICNWHTNDVRHKFPPF